MKFSAMASRLRPSPISDVFDRAQELRSRGVDLVDFSVGEPDMDTPSSISKAGKAAIDDGHTRYTSVDGMPALKDAIARKFARDQGLSFDRAQIVVGSGAKPVLAAAVAMVAGPGDEVIIPTPAWPSHIGMVDVAGADCVFLPTHMDNHYKIAPQSLEAALTQNTRLLILSSPSNPTGAVYSKTELRALAEVLRAYREVAIICDDLYEHIVFDGVEFSTLAQVAPELQPRILTVNGVSKAYAMTGWRIGYAAGPKDWARSIAGYFSQTEGSPCAISQIAAIEALDQGQEFLSQNRQIYQSRRDILVTMLEKSERLKVYEPQGSFYVFVDVSGVIGGHTPKGDIIKNDSDFANYLLDAGVVVTPGTAFEANDAMRISIATGEDKIKKGAARILEALSALT